MATKASEQDIKYAQEMIPHHEMAVEMSALEYANGQDEELKKFALNVYSKQKEEIKWLKAWLEKNGVSGEAE